MSLQTEWYVSISANDAQLAASGKAWTAADLEYGDDAKNHPQQINLPGGPKYGFRPLNDPAATKNGERLPHHFLSYAKQIDIPATYAGHRVFLTLDRTRYHVTVCVNGKQVAQYIGGWEPHRFDITDYVTPGEKAMLLITVGDSGVSGKQVFDTYIFNGTRLPTCKEIENNLVHPVAYGGADRAVGNVTIEALHPVRTEYVFANPKVAEDMLQYTVALANDTDQPVTVQVKSEAMGAKQLVCEEVTIPAHGTEKVYVEADWDDAILWDTDNPHLYDLHTTLTANGETLDVHEDYFGFREFTINGHSFYLNGTKIHLHGNSGHVGGKQDAMSLEEKMTFLRDLKEKTNLAHIRLHARPQDKRWVIAADRVGMLITTETALWTTGFHSFDWAGNEEGCYENVKNHFLEGLVRRDRNNPSVVIWSLSNEMSPITPYDLENPKMAAMTRIFKRIIAETEAEDDGRVIQMSSAMDFIGNMKMYNLHYPKNWQAFPDYPHTAYWLDSSFLFPWYGPARAKMPSWSWRKDKPLYFGEFTCVFGPTPDNQASIVGDVAFEEPDNGTRLVDEKLWPLEVKSYRRLDVSGFCAWAFALGDDTSVDHILKNSAVVAHTEAARPIAVLCHSYRTKYFAGDEVAMELSIHNDTRHEMELALRCDVLNGDEVIWTETMPPAMYGPAENLAFTNRFRAPATDNKLELRYRAILTSGDDIVDSWIQHIEVQPKSVATPFPTDCAFYDPDGVLSALFAQRGITGAKCLESLDPLTDLNGIRTLWLNFEEAKINALEWRRIRDAVQKFVKDGGCVVLDKATAALNDLPIALKNGKGFADGNRLEITYAYIRAHHHPVTQGLTDTDFSLWGQDYYLAHRCLATPEEGNAIPLLVAGTDRGGLTSTPLLEVYHGQGSFIVNTLELFGKLLEAPVASDILRAIASYRPQHKQQQVGVCVMEETMQRYREIGFEGDNVSLQSALQAELALIDGECLQNALSGIKSGLHAGKTIYLHALTVEQTKAVLAELQLPGEVTDGKAKSAEFDIFKHDHPLSNGMTHNYLYWIVDKEKLPAWSPAQLHPEPATALIKLQDGDAAAQLTRRGAVTVYQVGEGTLVIDNLRWHLAGFDEPERPRHYIDTLLTNLGVPLTRGAEKRMSQEFETAEERRERGHF
ncbi:MAG: glycoside hydrolase family 2 TIM barrel-domain containing protein [Armatimonadota bacterium]